MARFSELPNEIVSEIWRHILILHDVENFALVSKTIYTFAGPSLQDYRKLKELYTVVHVGDEKEVPNAIFGLDFLKIAMTHPHILSYVHELHIPSPCYGDLDGSQDPRRRPPWPSAIRLLELEKSATAFQQGTFPGNLALQEHQERLLSAMKDGGSDWMLALLLRILPNLEILDIEFLLEHPTCTSTTFADITKVPSTSSALRRLHELRLNGRGSMWDDWSLLRHFASLPFLTSLKCSGIENYPGTRKDLSNICFPPPCSNLLDLEIRDCGSFAQAVPVLQELTTQLKTFKYDSMGSEAPSSICKALLELARQSLEELTFKKSAPITAMGRMGSLQPFEKLKSLETNYCHLVDTETIVESQAMNLLPTSIEKIKLHVGYVDWYDHVRSFIRAILRQKRLDQLPTLHLLELGFLDLHDLGLAVGNENGLGFKDLQARASQIGLEIVLFKSDW